MFTSLKHLMPRGLYGRAALILILPVVMIQIVVSVTFIQRHFERVTEQMTQSVALEVQLMLDEVAAAKDLPDAKTRILPLVAALDMTVALPANKVSPGDTRARSTDSISGPNLVGKVNCATLCWTGKTPATSPGTR